MKRQDVLLATLAYGTPKKSFEPVHVQKALFLIDRHCPDLFDANCRYSFTPYDYGPFDSSVYHDLDGLNSVGVVSVDNQSGYGYRLYRATQQGIAAGMGYLSMMKPEQQTLIRNVVDTVLPLGFRQLVAAIYRSYPDMKVNSVFNN